MIHLASNLRKKEHKYSSLLMSLISTIIYMILSVTIIQTKELCINKALVPNQTEFSHSKIKIKNDRSKINFNPNEKNLTNLINNEEEFGINYTYSKLKNRMLQQSNCRITNCKSCPPRTQSTCTECNSGFYFSNNSACLGCSTGCLKCTSNSTCLQCDSSKNYFLNLNKTCSLCAKNCKSCDSSGKCLFCNPGYYLINKTSSLNSTSISTCQACFANCITCITGDSCLACNNYYLLDSINNKCLSCYESECDSCDIDGQCQKCKTGFYLNKDSVCNKCSIANCKLCNSEGKCEVCENGYFSYNEKSACKKCSDFDEICLSCSGDRLCNSCSGPAYLDYSLSNSFSTRTCKRCEIGTYVKNSNSCGMCTDFGKCSECSGDGCSLCMANSSPGDSSTCVCDSGYVSMGDACLSLLIIIVPIGFLGVLVIVATYCFIRFKNMNAINRRRVAPPNVNINNINNHDANLNQPNRANINNRNDNNIQHNNHHDNPDANNHRHIRVALENRILKPLASHDLIHGNKCIFGDESPPFWEFDCGGYMCNPCSLKLVTNFTADKSNCTKCTKPFSFFKFVNRFIENEDSVDLNNQSVIKIENIKSDSLNNSINESQNDLMCKICFVLKNSRQIKCDSNTPHVLCSYCYNRLINIEEIEHCPFCRNDVHR